MNVEGGTTPLQNIQDSGNVMRGGSEEEEIVFCEVEGYPEENQKAVELPHNKDKHYQYLKNWRRIDELLERGDEMAMMPKDCYSFISLHGPNEAIFWAGVLVFLFQMIFLLLALLSLMWSEWNTGKVDDNPSDGVMSNIFATEVGPILRATQIVSLITSIVFVDSSVADIITAIQTFPNYKIATKSDKVGSMALSCILRGTQGLFAFLVSLFLIFNSNNVIEVILNFTALNFISTLDNIFFEFSKSGKYGPRLEAEVKRIEDLRIPVCMFRKYKNIRFIFTFLPLVAIVFTFGFAVIAQQEAKLRWETYVLRVQFDDESLEAFNGCYFNQLERKDGISRRDFYVLDRGDEMVERHDILRYAEFGFCRKSQQWFLYEYDKKAKETDPCEFFEDEQIDEEEVKIFSASTDTFDISTMFLEDWFTGDGTPAELFFFEDLEKENEENLHCNAFIGNGVCDPNFNSKSFNFDGGDCCATTCSHEDCGIGNLINAFDLNNTVGDGYPDCNNEEMLNLTIALREFTNSREMYRNGLWTLTDSEAAFIEQHYTDFYTQEPAKALLTLYCDEVKVLKIYLDSSMQGRNETVKIPDEANCVIRFENSVGFGRRKFDDDPIWHVEYALYMDDKPPFLVGNSRDNGAKQFELVPSCAYDQLSYNASESVPEERKAMSWLTTTTESMNKKCADNYSELFALAVLNFAAPRTSSETRLWIENGPICEWDHITCTGLFASNNKTLDLLELDISGLRLSGSIPTRILSLSNLAKYQASNNALIGTLPSEIGDLASLTHFDIESNMISEALPSQIGKMESLEVLSLNSNNFTGSIPTEIGLLASLKWLNIAQNGIGGPIPSEIQYFTKLIYLNLSENNLTGTIPPEIGFMNSLLALNLGSNALRGPIPTEIGLLTNLLILDLDKTSLTGSIPSELDELSTLEIIYMDDVSVSQDTVSPFLRSKLAESCSLCNNFGFEPIDDPICPYYLEKWTKKNGRTSTEICVLLAESCVDCKSEEEYWSSILSQVQIEP